jgi:hypothetical protein
MTTEQMMEEGEAAGSGPKEVPFSPRNRWKAIVRREGESVVKDYGSAPLLARLAGAVSLRWEEAALRRLEGMEAVPSFEGRPSPWSIRMKAVPGAPLALLRAGAFLESLVGLFREVHGRGVAHGDLHQRNILMHEERPYVIDFSTAYVRGRLPVLDAHVFRWFTLLDWERIYKVEKKFFGRGEPPRMFLLYRLAKGV